MTYIPDPTELGEMRCEDWAFENVTGDSFRCSCGEIAKLDEAETVSPDPYAIPICKGCFEYWCKHKSIQKGES